MGPSLRDLSQGLSLGRGRWRHVLGPRIVLMRVTVLGSSGGYPAPGSACSGYLLEVGSTVVWIDAGSGTLSRLLERRSFADLTALLISHLHADHWTDVPLAIHALRFVRDRERPLPVHGPRGWPETMGIVARWAREDRPAFVPNELHEREAIDLGEISVEPIHVEHSDLETFGFRVSDGASVVAYSADSGPCDALHALAAEADLFICEAGAPDHEQPGMHLTARQAGEIAAKAGAHRLVITHLAPRDDRRRALAAAQEAFSGPVELAVEGLAIDA
jgi:ribonuclease BN (tRNA processing enzyme)